MHALAPHACMHPLTPLPVHACMQAKQAFEEQQEEVRRAFKEMATKEREEREAIERERDEAAR
jgi:hypothetical protein